MYFGYMCFGYIFLLGISVLMLITETHAVGVETGNNNTVKIIKILPYINSSYCVEKFSCDGNKTYAACHCDSLCGIYDDCCEGFNGTATNTIPLSRSQITCLSVSGINNKMFGALVVTSCPNGSDDQLRSYCEGKRRRGVRLSDTYTTSDGIMFYNIYCAFCNGMFPSYSIEDLEQCDNETLRNTDFCNTLYDGQTTKNSFRSCPLRALDSCKSNVIQGSDLCRDMGFRLVYDSLGNMYKNKYCAICDEKPEGELLCEEGEVEVGVPYAYDQVFAAPPESVPPKPARKAEINCKNNTDLFNNSSDNSCETDPVNVTDKNNIVKAYLTLIGLTISSVALFITLIIYGYFRVLMNTPGKITFSLALSLLLAQFLFLLSSEAENVTWLCVTMAILVHYFFLVAFCWMNVIAFDLWMTFSNNILDIDDEKKFTYYSIYAWCVPLAIIIIGIILNFSDVSTFSPRYGQTICLISSEAAQILLFIGPLALFKLFDIVAFVFTSYYIAKARREAAFATENKSVCSFFINIKLSLIMGLTWTFAVLAKIHDSQVLRYLFIIFNSLQGLFIFICFICTKRVLNLILRKYRPISVSKNTGQTRLKSNSGTRSTSI